MNFSSCKFATLIIVVPLLNLALDCHDAGTEPPVDTNRVKLTMIDAGVREAYLSLTVAQPPAAETIIVERNGVSILRLSVRSFSTTDTIFADTGLTENTAYSYQASLLWKGTTTVKSNPVQVQTLTPTSHSFTWQSFVLGGGDDSGLRDVTIIDDSNIYAVGEVSVRDSTGAVQNPPYNVVSSDGRTSKPLTILYNCRLFWPDCGPNTQFYTEATALFAFTASDVWICAGSVHHLKGAGWEEFAGNGAGSATKIWGSSQSDMYFVGYNGTIVHSDGNTWQRLQSGTATPINDVWGVTNPASGKEEVYCAVSDIFQFKDRKILKLVDGKIDSIAWDAQRDVVLNLWTHQGFPFYVGGGSGLYENKTNTWQKVDFGTNVYPSSVRGTSLNNIIVVGSFGLVAHYNGVDWKILTTDVPDAAYSAVAVKGNMAAAVGSKNGRAILTIGRQQ